MDSQLIDRYIDRIFIDEINYEDHPESDHDLITLYVNLPIELIDKYKREKGLEGNPNPEEFWHETGLHGKLREIKIKSQHDTLEDAIELLDGEVMAEFL